MKRFILLIAIAFFLVGTMSYAKGDDILRKSEMYEPPNFGPIPSSFPQRFSEIGQNPTQPQISTGYYFVDSDDDAPDYWRPIPEIVDTSTEPTLWRRIIQGPRILPKEYWDDNPQEGHRFFHNPAKQGVGVVDFFKHGSATAVDSTDNAIAGPIPIGFGFYFNGLRYDSFYVTTNGLIALTNRRYFYNANGERTIPTGGTTCYDPMSMDWFVRARSGDGLNDANEDNFGYTVSVLGNAAGSYLGGIRTPNGPLNGLNPAHKAAIIAPFWGDNHLSQYANDISQPDDWGKCFFKRSNAADKLIIYYINIAPVGLKATPSGTYNAPANLRRGEANYISANAQVILDRTDSSVTIVYERFDGIAIVNRRAQTAMTIFRYNTTCGVRGFARHVNYGQPGGPSYPWASEYEQFTHYFHKYAADVNYPHNQLAVKFKQWQNSLRVVDIQYRIRKPDENASLDFTEIVPSTKVNDYELLAGEERIGAIQPVALIQNLTNEIQGPTGVNFVPQDFNFRARFRIINLATERIIYNRLVPVDSTCLATPDSTSEECTGNPDVRVRLSSVTVKNGDYTAASKDFPGTQGYNGIPPYEFVQVFFPPFEPNEFVDNQIGRMRAFIIADPTDPRTGEGVGDEWPFDDTRSVRLFVMKRLDRFNDDVTEFHFVETIEMPSVLKWVNIDAQVVSGDNVSHYPLPPRGGFAARNNENDSLTSPVIRMDRITLDRLEPANSPGGDELRSFPIDMRNEYNAVISLSVQRTASADDWERGWSDNLLIGAEPRSVLNADVFNVWTRNRFAASYKPDELRVELAQPSPDGIKFITNINDKRWQNHPRREGAKPVTDMPALSIYGAGGYMTGFLEEDKDSSLSRPAAGLLNGLRPNLYDDGIDWVYKKYFVAIPDTFIRAANEGAKNFRFRLKMYATNDKKCLVCIPDDDDAYFVDNVRLLFYSPEATDIGVTAVKIDWPYTMAPASQATAIPISVRLSNNTSNDAPSYTVTVAIWKKGEYRDLTKIIYCRTKVVSSHPGPLEIEMGMPAWNARKAGPGEYRLEAMVYVPGGDLEELNDTTYKDITIKFGDAFAYDPVDNPRNDVPGAAFSGTPGRGLNLYGFAVGGNGNDRGPRQIYNEDVWGAGFVGGNGSGQIAVRFNLLSNDTIYGFQAFFGLLNQDWDNIRFAVYSDAGGRQPGTEVPGSVIFKSRGYDDIRDDFFWNEYVTYLYDTPLVLESGTYWATIAQLGETGLELGASKSRVGMRTTNVFIPPPTAIGGPTGRGGYSLMIEKTFRTMVGNNLINKNFFAVENTIGNGTWMEFMPSVGNPAYAHLHHFGISPLDGATATLSRGTWIPMIRPYLGERSYASIIDYLKDNCIHIPIELSYFTGAVRSGKIDLEWETASEENNYGFYVEKREFNTDVENKWEAIGFVPGNSNSKVTQKYNFTDDEVVLNRTYQYRLRQVDFDGTYDCTSSGIVTLKYDGYTPLTLKQNSPNPVNEYTNFEFNLPTNEDITLEIVDVYGNVVKTIRRSLSSGNNFEKWDCTDDNGVMLPSGTYIYRLTAGDETATRRLTVVR